MARIRTIKPEFAHSESMGRVSRDARLLFIQLWTLCDDAGRTRAASRMLASLLFPYDDDAGSLIDGWLEELEREGCIKRYRVDGQTYLQVCNWLTHQKIDKPSASKFPAFDEPSRILANPREPSSEEGKGVDQGVDQGEKTSLSPPSGSTAPEGREEKPKPPPCPYGQIVDAYHEVLPAAPRVVILTDSRKEHIQARWRQVWEDEPFDANRGVELFRGYFQRVSQSKFLTGKVTRRDNGKPFVADLAWLVKPENFAKVIEGKYA